MDIFGGVTVTLRRRDGSDVAAAGGVSVCPAAVDAVDVEKNDEKGMCGGEIARKTMKKHKVLKEMLRHCAEDGAMRMADKLVDKEQKMEDLLVVQLKEC